MVFLSIIFIPVLLIIGVVYLVIRLRQNDQEVFSSHNILIGYFYLVTTAGVIMMTVGLIYFIKIAFSRLYSTGSIIQDIIMGTVMLAVGAVIYISHVAGRIMLEKARGQTYPKAKKSYHIYMLVLSSLASLISIPLALYSTISYHYYGYWYIYGNPSTELAMVVVLVPIWIYFLLMVIKDARGNGTT